MSDTPQSPAQDSLAEHDEARPMRTVKSFVMRAGRMTEGQQRGLDLGWPKFGLELSDEAQDFDAIFGRQAPRTFEIGFGMGHSTLEMPPLRLTSTSSASRCTSRASARCSTAC